MHMLHQQGGQGARKFRSGASGHLRGFEIKPLPLTIPIGAEDSFKGVVDVLKKKALMYEKDGSGSFKEAAVPADMADQLDEVYGKGHRGPGRGRRCPDGKIPGRRRTLPGRARQRTR
ncbi:MAG: hypothetical protein MZU79_00185 [Anaerotruncus sp.]|nr:hypothetical protein [Anaerotruncus sp.]